MTHEYEKSEMARIDELIKDLRKEKKEFLKEMEPVKEVKLSKDTTAKIIVNSMGYYINALLDGKRSGYALETGVPDWGNNYATFIIHGLWDLNHEQITALASTEYYSDTPEDGNPVFSTRLVVCDQHINCMQLEVEVYYSNNDWKRLIE